MSVNGYRYNHTLLSMPMAVAWKTQNKQVDAACNSEVLSRLFMSSRNEAPVVVGLTVLRSNVPRNYLEIRTTANLAELVEERGRRHQARGASASSVEQDFQICLPGKHSAYGRCFSSVSAL